MGSLLRNSVLILFVWLMLVGTCFGKQVFLSDGSIIDCESFWRSGDKVVVKINRDTVLEFAKNEIDERRTFVKAVKKTRPAKRKKIAAAGVSAKAATSAGTAEAAPAPSVATAAVPAASPAPAPVHPPPAAEAPVQPEAAQPAPPAPSPAPDQAAPQEHLPAIPQLDALFAGSVVTILLVLGALSLLIIVAMWVVFTKAGQAGWKSLVPIYNIYILLVIAGVPGWWLILLLIPLVGLVFHLLAMLALAKKFGKGTLFAIGLFLLPIIFYPLLAFGGARYEG